MRKRNTWRLIVAVLSGALLAGCGTVWTSQPLPQARLSAEEQARIAGTWVLQLNEGMPYSVDFDCAGVAHLAVLNSEHGHFTLEQVVFVVARGEHSEADSGFLSLPEDHKGQPSGYLLMRYKLVSATDLVMWWPDPAPFRAAIKAGRLKGTVKDDQGKQVTTPAELTATPQQVLDFLDDPANPPLFDYEKPYLFRKVAGGGGPGAGCGK